VTGTREEAPAEGRAVFHVERGAVRMVV
jgi:hypothetical protein